MRRMTSTYPPQPINCTSFRFLESRYLLVEERRFLKANEMITMEALINSTNEMKCEAHGTQQPRHINLIGEGASTAQRSNSLVQSINQRFPKAKAIPEYSQISPGFY